jgi:hypothetical protein
VGFPCLDVNVKNFNFMLNSISNWIGQNHKYLQQLFIFLHFKLNKLNLRCQQFHLKNCAMNYHGEYQADVEAICGVFN